VRKALILVGEAFLALLLNITAGLLQRPQAIAIARWGWLLFLMHATYLLVSGENVTRAAATLRGRFGETKMVSYIVVGLAFAAVGIFYWYGINVAYAHLFSTPVNQPSAGMPSAKGLRIEFESNRDIKWLEDGRMARGLLRVRNRDSGLSILDVALKILRIDILHLENPAAGQKVSEISSHLTGLPLVVWNDFERPPRKSVMLNPGEVVDFEVFEAQRRAEGIPLYITHAIRVALSTPGGGQTAYVDGIDGRIPFLGEYRILVIAEGRDVEPYRFAYTVSVSRGLIKITGEAQP
jgi:hypothetical protein